MMKWFYKLSLLIILALISCQPKDEYGPKKVVVINVNGNYELLVNNKPFFIKGAGIDKGSIEKLAEFGANSLRVWRTDNARNVLDEAQKNGLLVMLGLDVQRERHGFDYNDTAAVNEQKTKIKEKILKYKDHPALLAWAIGNELNLGYTNPKVFDAANEISLMIHELDKNHPTTTTLAGFNPDVVKEVKNRCPDLDFISIQEYGSIITLPEQIKRAEWSGPYAITEWGATGHWEVSRTEWDIAIEQTSTEKAKTILQRWEKAVSRNRKQNLGSFAFVWGYKQERTPTWYGLLLESGEETEMTDVLYYVWNEKWPDNRSPSIDSIFIDGQSRYQNVYLKKGSEYKFQVYAHDKENDTLQMVVNILPDDPASYRSGGDYEERPEPVFSDTIDYSPEYIFKTPNKEGPYRIFAFILDGNDNAATGNVPFFIKE
ncbi:MAG: hypothetical protein JW894_04300 [Bacteroidales bacterium]|nr:hypothetical protein [Bacteroidales bacterium]